MKKEYISPKMWEYIVESGNLCEESFTEILSDEEIGIEYGGGGSTAGSRRKSLWDDDEDELW